MAGKQAKIPSASQIKAALAYLDTTRHSQRNRAIFLLSYHAGLRSCEIAGVEWLCVMGADGDIGTQLALENRAAKMGSGRTIPMSNDLRAALRSLYASKPPHLTSFPIIYSERGQGMSAASITQFFFHLYLQLGFTGMSSHSGRRWFLTQGARKIASVGGSLRDIQYLAGHASLTTTARYIETDNEAAQKMVNLL
jgi:integrase/recombinase XerD